MAKCLACNSSKNRILFRTKDKDSRDVKSNQIFNLAKCSNCGLVFVENMPSKNEMAKYYGKGYYAKKNISNSIMNKVIMASRLSKMPSKKNGSVLDYGCGNGDFLLKMKENGWNTNGVEFSNDAKRIAGNKLREKIMDEKDFYKSNKKFDAITMWHVLEHLHEPEKTLSKLKGMLNKNGLLVISVPNIESWQFYLFGKNTFHLDIPRHITHYSQRTIRMLLEKNGFKVAGFNHYSIEYNPFGFIQSFLNSIGCEFNFLYNLLKRGYRRRVGMIKFMYSFMATFILLPFLTIAAVPVTYAESFFGHGASFVVYAKR